MENTQKTEGKTSTKSVGNENTTTKCTKCEHKKVLPIYARDQIRNRWISSIKIRGKMIYICEGCGAILKEEKTILEEGQ